MVYVPTAKQIEKYGVYAVLSFVLWFGFKVYEDVRDERLNDREFYASQFIVLQDQVQQIGQQVTQNYVLNATVIRNQEESMLKHLYTDGSYVVVQTPPLDGSVKLKIPYEVVPTNTQGIQK
jgi:NAD kinase